MFFLRVISNNHPANYKGCKVYQELVVKQKKEKPVRSNIQNFNMEASDFPELSKGSPKPNIANSTNIPRSYSDVCKINNTYSMEQVPPFSRLEQLLEKQIEQTSSLINMLVTVINKLCK
jgi:hypothetical protein